MLTRAFTAIGIALALAAFFHPTPAQAQNYIIRYGRVPIGYTTEVEPHLVLGSAPPGASMLALSFGFCSACEATHAPTRPKKIDKPRPWGFGSRSRGRRTSRRRD